MESASTAWGGDQPDLAAQESRQFPADREPESRAAILPAGRAIRLLKRLEDDLLLVGGDPDTRVRYGEEDHLRCLIQFVVVRAPSAGCRFDRQRNLSVMG